MFFFFLIFKVKPINIVWKNERILFLLYDSIFSNGLSTQTVLSYNLAFSYAALWRQHHIFNQEYGGDSSCVLDISFSVLVARMNQTQLKSFELPLAVSNSNAKCAVRFVIITSSQIIPYKLQ